MFATYTSLCKDAEKIKSRKLYNAVDHILDSARINADDTVYLEKNDGDWHEMALNTVESSLAYCNDKAVVAWFVRRGVRF